MVFIGIDPWLCVWGTKGFERLKNMFLRICWSHKKPVMGFRKKSWKTHRSILSTVNVAAWIAAWSSRDAGLHYNSLLATERVGTCHMYTLHTIRCIIPIIILFDYMILYVYI
jgi:hypothetical protein